MSNKELAAIWGWEIGPAAKALADVKAEYYKAVRRYPPMASAHEGYAVILEELDELWEEVRKQQSQHDRACMRKEAMQVAAMALRFMVDVCGTELEEVQP